RLKECPECAPPLGETADSWSRPVTNLPDPSHEIFDLVVWRYKCSNHGGRVQVGIPEARRGDFGPRFQASVAELRLLGMPFEIIAELLRMRDDLEGSVASPIAMEVGVAESLDGTYRSLGEQLRDAKRTPWTQGDERGMRVLGKTEWRWEGTPPALTVYPIQTGWSGDVAATMWVGYRGTPTHDGLASYNSVTEGEQPMDVVQGNRWLQQVPARVTGSVRGGC
ncbi:transposase IS66, partial [mine drainage metagenome]